MKHTVVHLLVLMMTSGALVGAQDANLVSPFPNLRILQPNIQYLRSNSVTEWHTTPEEYQEKYKLFLDTRVKPETH